MGENPPPLPMYAEKMGWMNIANLPAVMNVPKRAWDVMVRKRFTLSWGNDKDGPSPAPMVTKKFSSSNLISRVVMREAREIEGKNDIFAPAEKASRSAMPNPNEV